MRKQIVGLLLVLLIALAVRIHFQVGSLGSDDGDIWRRAMDISHGYWNAPHPKADSPSSFRLGLILPIALILKIFGSSEGTVVLFPLICSLLSISIIYKIVADLTKSTFFAICAGLWMAFMGLDVFQAGVALADGPMCTFLLLGFFLLMRAQNSWSYGFAGACFGMAISIKESGTIGVGATAVWIALLISHQRKIPRCVFPLVLGFALQQMVELVVIWSMYGNPFNRYMYLRELLVRYPKEMAQINRASVGSNAWGMLKKVKDDLPIAFYTSLVSLGAFFIAVGHWRRNGFRWEIHGWIISFVLVYILLRIPEAKVTFSYQPRRLSPLICMGIILAALVASHWRSRKWIYFAFACFPIFSAHALFSHESIYLGELQRKMDLERAVIRWQEKNEVEPIYTDRRTAFNLKLMNQLPVELYPQYWKWNQDGTFVRAAAPDYFAIGTLQEWVNQRITYLHSLEKGYWLVNHRYPVPLRVTDDVLPNWKFIAYLNGGAALFKISNSTVTELHPLSISETGAFQWPKDSEGNLAKGFTVEAKIQNSRASRWKIAVLAGDKILAERSVFFEPLRGKSQSMNLYVVSEHPAEKLRLEWQQDSNEPAHVKFYSRLLR